MTPGEPTTGPIPSDRFSHLPHDPGADRRPGSEPSDDPNDIVKKEAEATGGNDLA